jgi:predicted HicB family RNase H-like nuclease
MANTKRMDKAVSTTVYLDEKEHEAAKRFAAASRLSLAELIRQALARYLKSQSRRKAARR